MVYSSLIVEQSSTELVRQMSRGHRESILVASRSSTRHATFTGGSDSMQNPEKVVSQVMAAMSSPDWLEGVI